MRQPPGTSHFSTEQFLREHENKSLLRLLTCGSVDDGKSTLIGRLLFDSKLLFEDQLTALERDSLREGNAGEGEMDYALLLDGLKDEREQGITIDVAYRYFTTPNRKFIIADSPGHEQYTRNMATGASTADVAIILIDARKGVITQTRRHSFIVSLLGIRHVVVAVNKMDLVDFDPGRYQSIRRDFETLNRELALADVRFVPLSALRGDNVVERSPRTPWYEGSPLLELLERVDTAGDRNLGDFRLPVQLVIRPNLDFRGFAGTVASGVIRRGDRITALPSMRESTVQRIVTADGDLEEAFAPQAVTLTLSDEIDVGVGEMLVHPQNPPHVGSHFTAMLIWFSASPLNPRTTYLLRQTSRSVNARVAGLEFRVDVNTMEKQPAETLRLNEIGRANLVTHQPLFFDSYPENRETGSFILIDPVSNNTVAAGMIERPGADLSQSPLTAQVDRREFVWERGLVSCESRIARNQHRGKTVLFVGPPDSGKRDLARRLELTLFDKGLQAYYLGMSSLLEGLEADIGQNFRDRDEHIRRMGELARILTDAGLIFISSLDRSDEVDLQRLKVLNSPNELFVVSLGGGSFGDFPVDLAIPSGTSPSEAVQTIVRELTRAQVIIEYCI